MLISYSFKPENLYNAMHELIRMTFPGSTLVKEDESKADLYIEISHKIDKDKMIVNGCIKETGKSTVLNREYLLPAQDYYNEMNRNWRRFCFELLSKHQNKLISSYGILTGVRPVKLVHRLLDNNYNREKIKEILKNDFYLQEDKACLLTEVAFNNRSYLLKKEETKKLVSVYIGIPYCPTRCYYCSFPGAVLKDYEKDIKPFLKALLKEIKIIGQFLKDSDIGVQSVYVGGGTPTILSEEDTVYLMDAIADHIVSEKNTLEITVEAGRPDTLSAAKLKILKESGVNRVCINPQTMNDATLSLVGRKHTEKGVIDAVELARKVGIRQINMDIIVGLPGEGKNEYTYTANKLLKLHPENLTVHTLALKRGSIMAEYEGKNNIEMRISKVEEGIRYFNDALREANYIPYYLYRQKYMKGDMENIGYSKLDEFCIYNIQMIEERQTIIGLGGGSASKFVTLEDWSLSSLYNPKDPNTYIESIERLIERKVDKLRALN